MNNKKNYRGFGRKNSLQELDLESIVFPSISIISDFLDPMAFVRKFFSKNGIEKDKQKN